MKDPARRLGGGVNDGQELRQHPFFKVTTFKKIAYLLVHVSSILQTIKSSFKKKYIGNSYNLIS